MTAVNTIRRLTIEATAKGIPETTAALRGLGNATDGVAVAGTRSEKATQSAQRALERQQRQLDMNYRSMKQYEQAERDLDRARSQGLLTQQRYNDLLQRAATLYRSSATANDNYAGSIRNLSQVMSMLPGAVGNAATRVSTLTTGLGAALIAASGTAAAVTLLATVFYTLARGQDQLALVEARLRNVTGSATAAADALRPLFEGSQRTGVNFNDTIQAFQRLGLAARDMGAAQADVIRLTQAVQQLGRLGGASTQELQSGMIQFGQALASGRLQGDELRSIMENMPLLARAIAEGLGVSVGQLRQMGAAGELTSDRVFKAILGQTDEINRKFSELPQTVDMGLTRVANAWNLAIGRMGKRIEANRPLMLLLNALSGGLEHIAEGLDDSVMARAARLERAANDPGRAVGTDAAGNTIRDRSASIVARRQLQEMMPELQDDAFIRTVEAAKAANENTERQIKATEELRRKAEEVSKEYARQTELQRLGEDAVKRIEAREKAVADVLKSVGLTSLEGINSLTQERADIILLAATRAADEAEQKVRIEQGVKAAAEAEKERLKAAKATADELNRWLDGQQEVLKAQGEQIKADTERERGQIAANDNLEDYIRKLEDAATVDGRTTEEKKIQRAIIEAQNKLYDKQGDKIRDLEQTEKDRIGTAVRQTEELEKQRKAIEDRQREIERASDRALDQISDAAGDILFDYMDGRAGSFWDTFKRLGMRAFADIAASTVVQAVLAGPVRGITSAFMGGAPAGGTGAASAGMTALNGLSTASSLSNLGGMFSGNGMFSASSLSNFFSLGGNPLASMGSGISGFLGGPTLLSGAAQTTALTEAAMLAGSGAPITALSPLAATGIGVGLLVAGFALSKLLGGKKSVGPNGGAYAGLDPTGLLGSITAGSDNGGSSQGSQQMLQSTSQFIAEALKTSGGRLRAGTTFGFSQWQEGFYGFAQDERGYLDGYAPTARHGGTYLAADADQAATVLAREILKSAEDIGENFALVLKNSTAKTMEELGLELQGAKTIETLLGPAEEKISDLLAGLRAQNKVYDDAIAFAEKYTLTEQTILDLRKKQSEAADQYIANVNKSIQDRILQIEDPYAYQMKQIGAARAAEIRAVSEVGGDVAAVHKLYDLMAQQVANDNRRLSFDEQMAQIEDQHRALEVAAWEAQLNELRQMNAGIKEFIGSDFDKYGALSMESVQNQMSYLAASIVEKFDQEKATELLRLGKDSGFYDPNSYKDLVDFVRAAGQSQINRNDATLGFMVAQRDWQRADSQPLPPGMDAGYWNNNDRQRDFMGDFYFRLANMDQAAREAYIRDWSRQGLGGLNGLPFLGSFASGGVITREGWAHVGEGNQREHIVPASQFDWMAARASQVVDIRPLLQEIQALRGQVRDLVALGREGNNIASDMDGKLGTLGQGAEATSAGQKPRRRAGMGR